MTTSTGRPRRTAIGVLLVLAALLAATFTGGALPAARATADYFLGVQSPVIKTTSGASQVVSFGVLGYGSTLAVALDSAGSSPDSLAATTARLDDHPQVAYAVRTYLNTTDRYTAAALSYYVRKVAPDRRARDAEAAMAALKSTDSSTYSAVMSRYASISSTVAAGAGPYTTDPYLTGSGSPMTGEVKHIGVQSASGRWISGRPVMVTLAGPAVFTDGSMTKSGTTSGSPQSWAWKANGSGGTVTATVKVSGLPPTTYRLHEASGRQRLATVGPATSQAAGSATSASLVPLTPARVLDTRKAVKPGGQSTTEVTVTGRGGVPTSGVAAVVLNVTVTNPAAPGWLTAWPGRTQRPTASNLNYVKDQVVANHVVVKVDASGKINLYASQSAHLVVDVTGYYPAGAGYHGMAPTRLLDTRADAHPKPGPGSTTRLAVAGRGGVPATGVAAVVLNVTAVTPSTAGYGSI